MNQWIQMGLTFEKTCVSQHCSFIVQSTNFNSVVRGQSHNPKGTLPYLGAALLCTGTWKLISIRLWVSYSGSQVQIWAYHGLFTATRVSFSKQFTHYFAQIFSHQKHFKDYTVTKKAHCKRYTMQFILKETKLTIVSLQFSRWLAVIKCYFPSEYITFLKPVKCNSIWNIIVLSIHNRQKKGQSPSEDGQKSYATHLLKMKTKSCSSIQGN